MLKPTKRFFWYSAIRNEKLEAQIPTPNPEIPKKHRVYTNFSGKFTRTFPCFPLARARVRNPTEIVQINSFRLTFYFGCILFLRVGDFPPVKNQPKVFLHKFFTRGRRSPNPRDIPATACLKTTEKGHLHKVFVRDIPTSASLTS